MTFTKPGMSTSNALSTLGNLMIAFIDTDCAHLYRCGSLRETCAVVCAIPEARNYDIASFLRSSEIQPV